MKLCLIFFLVLALLKNGSFKITTTTPSINDRIDYLKQKIILNMKKRHPERYGPFFSLDDEASSNDDYQYEEESPKMTPIRSSDKRKKDFNKYKLRNIKSTASTTETSVTEKNQAVINAWIKQQKQYNEMLRSSIKKEAVEDIFYRRYNDNFRNCQDLVAGLVGLKSNSLLSIISADEGVVHRIHKCLRKFRAYNS